MKLSSLLPTLASAVLLSTSHAGDSFTIKGTDNITWEKKETVVKPGDQIIWIVDGDSHGVVFSNYASAQKYLQIDPTILPITPKKFPDRPNDKDPQGTEVKSDSGTVLVKATVLALPSGTTLAVVDFFCTRHHHMEGTVKIQAVGPGPAPASERK